MEVRHRQELGFALGQPLACGSALTLGAVPVAAAVVGDDGVSALLVLAARHMAAEYCRAAALDRAHDPFGALCVVTSDTLDYPDEFYRFFSDGGFGWFGFQVEEAEGVHGASSLMSRNRIVDVETLERY